MKHEISITEEEADGVMHVAGACSCGWSGGNVRPSRPGRLAEMRAHLEANHAAWRATPTVVQFEEAFDKLGDGPRAAIEAAMKAKAPDVTKAAFGARARADIEAIVKAEGLPSLWPNAEAAAAEEGRSKQDVIDEVKRVR